MTEMVTSGLMRGRWRRSDGPLEGDTRPKRGETAGPRTPWTPPRQRPTLLWLISVIFVAILPLIPLMRRVRAEENERARESPGRVETLPAPSE